MSATKEVFQNLAGRVTRRVVDLGIVCPECRGTEGGDVIPANANGDPQRAIWQPCPSYACRGGNVSGHLTHEGPRR